METMDANVRRNAEAYLQPWILSKEAHFLSMPIKKSMNLLRHCSYLLHLCDFKIFHCDQVRDFLLNVSSSLCRQLRTDIYTYFGQKDNSHDLRNVL